MRTSIIASMIASLLSTSALSAPVTQPIESGVLNFPLNGTAIYNKYDNSVMTIDYSPVSNFISNFILYHELKLNLPFINLLGQCTWLYYY